MGALTAFLRLDLMTVRPYGRSILVLLVIGLGLGAANASPYGIVPILSVYALLVVGYPFAAADKYDLTTLYATLPVPRRTVVVGRYLTTILGLTAAVLLGTLASLLYGALGGVGVDARALGLLAVGSLAVSTLVAGTQLPLYFALGYTRARIWALVPFVVIVAVGTGALTAAGDRLDDVHLERIAGRPVLLGVGIVVVAALLTVASARLSARLYERRDL